MNRMRKQFRNQRRALMRRVNAFTSKHPYIGPVLWLLSIQYFVVQCIVALAWPQPYNLRVNVISDLGAVMCGMLDSRYVCSPLSPIMNLSFIIFGITISLGTIFIYTAFKRSNVYKLGFLLMLLSGLGTIVVGIFPLDAVPIGHNIGAFGALLLGNVALLLLAWSLRGIRKSFRLYTLATGIVCVTAFVLFSIGQDLGIGLGNIERVASYPYVLWLMVFGSYMTVVRKKRNLKSYRTSVQ